MGPNLNPADLFVDGRLRVKEGFTWGFKDASGKWAIPPRYNDAQNFEKGFARVQEGATWKRIDVRGRVVAEDTRKIVPIEDSHEGLALARQADLLGWLDGKEKPAFPFRKYEEAHKFSSGRARFKLDGLYGYLDKTGAIAIPNKYWAAGDFDHGLAFVQTKEGMAYIDPKGGTVWEGKR